MVQEIPRLLDEEIKNVEGKITLDETTTALKNMTSNKSPETDGLHQSFFF